MKVLSSLKFENMLLPCHLHHPPPLTSCPASTPHSAHLAGAAPSFQKLCSSHRLAKIISSAVSKVSWCCLNSYRSAIITAFSFSPRMCGDNRGLGVVVEKRMHSESERISGHLAAQTYTFRKRELNESGFLKILLWVSRDAALIFTFFFSLSLFLLVRRGPEYFSSLMDARAVTLPWLYYRTPSYLLWPERGRQAAAFSLARQTEALLVNEPERLGSVDGCLSSAGAYCNSSPLAARACVSLLC